MSCGDKVESEEISKDRIEDIFEDIEILFAQGDTDKIMDFYHEDYLHNGDILENAEYNWETRAFNYNFLDFENLEFEFDSFSATVSFHMILANPDSSVTFVEPLEHGDLSYFYKEEGLWQVYGNQESTGYGSGFNLDIDTSPDGARVYIDDTFMHQLTPTKLYFMPAGNHDLRLYKDGFNEVELEINIPDTMSVSVNLEEPDFPKPYFDLISPTNHSHYDQMELVIEGSIKIIDEYGDFTDFDGSEYIMNLNNEESVFITQGNINKLISLEQGQNSLELRATAENGNTATSERFIIYGDF